MIQSWQAIAARHAPENNYPAIARTMRGASTRYVVADDAAFIDDQCPKCGADLDDGECEECERVAPLDFDT